RRHPERGPAGGTGSTLEDCGTRRDGGSGNNSTSICRFSSDPSSSIPFSSTNLRDVSVRGRRCQRTIACLVAFLTRIPCRNALTTAFGSSALPAASTSRNRPRALISSSTPSVMLPGTPQARHHGLLTNVEATADAVEDFHLCPP